MGELGYALTLDHDVETGRPIAAERLYTYIVDRGPVALGGVDDKSTVELTGQTLIDMKSDNYASAVTQQQSKALLRMLLQHYLGGQSLHTRTLLLDLKQM